MRNVSLPSRGWCKRSRQTPIMRAPTSYCWFILLMLWFLSAFSQAQPCLGLPRATTLGSTSAATASQRLLSWLRAVNDPVLKGLPPSPYYRRAMAGLLETAAGG